MCSGSALSSTWRRRRGRDRRGLQLHPHRILAAPGARTSSMARARRRTGSVGCRGGGTVGGRPSLRSRGARPSPCAWRPSCFCATPTAVPDSDPSTAPAAPPRLGLQALIPAPGARSAGATTPGPAPMNWLAFAPVGAVSRRRTVSERLGHSSVRVTAEVYSHASGRDREAADLWDQIKNRDAATHQTAKGVNRTAIILFNASPRCLPCPR